MTEHKSPRGTTTAADAQDATVSTQADKATAPEDHAGGVADQRRLIGPAAHADLARRFGERVRELRTAAGLSVGELGARCETTDSAISKIERGRSEPRLWQIVRVCRGLDVTPDMLLGDLVRRHDPAVLARGCRDGT
jgi:ribosome-binding protein aMBF1 (putative translation factor)